MEGPYGIMKKKLIGEKIFQNFIKHNSFFPLWNVRLYICAKNICEKLVCLISIFFKSSMIITISY